MPQCNRCEDKTEYEWFENFQGKWRLGIKLDINNYRPHKCQLAQLPVTGTTTSNKRNWKKIVCEKCKSPTRINVKLYQKLNLKDLNLCSSCQSY